MTDILGCSRAHYQLLRLVDSAAAADAEVLIHGPSGVGKELYARLIHEKSRRSTGPFVPLNCGAIPADLFENELFGHVGGAFTGARARAAGLVSQANGGTLFLDEIDTLHSLNQVKLLRLIQEKEYRRLGDAQVSHCNVRIIAATNVDLVAAVKAGNFRFDLFFRLRVLPIGVPPLRDRREDIDPLLAHFTRKYAAEYGQQEVTFSEAAQERLRSYRWPGNVRELENCVRFLLCTCAGTRIDANQLPLLDESLDEAPLRREPALPSVILPASGETLRQTKQRLVRAFEKAYVEDSLKQHGGNITAAARACGKHRRAFFELMRRHGVTRAH